MTPMTDDQIKDALGLSSVNSMVVQIVRAVELHHSAALDRAEAVRTTMEQFDLWQLSQSFVDSNAALTHLCTSHGMPAGGLEMQWLDERLGELGQAEAALRIEPRPVTETGAPNEIWAWSFNDWANWGGYARGTNMRPLDAKEVATGAVYIRKDQADAAFDRESAENQEHVHIAAHALVELVKLRNAIAKAEADKADARTLLARSLVFDHGSAEEGVEFLGGWDAMTQLVDHHRARGDA